MSRKATWFVAWLVSVATAVLLIVPGCGGGSSTQAGNGDDASLEGGMTGDATTGDAGSDTGVPKEMGCSKYPGQNPASLPGAGCCDAGPSHCAPTSSIPPAIDNAFNACSSGGLCVPDTIIEAGSEYVPASCTTKILTWTLPGVCLSKCITLVSNNSQESLLKPETCGTGELCVPCTDPLTMQSTGACTISNLVCSDGGTDAGLGGGGDGGGPTCPYTGPPLLDPTTFPACAPACNGAHCVPSSLVPASDQSQLASCMSSGMPGFCAPDTFIQSAGYGVPKTCTSVAGSEGRCLSVCLPEVASQQDLLPQDVCMSDERCAPCYDPVAADASAPTGACSLACDKPTKPPVTLTCPYSGAPVVDPTVFPACSPACAGAHCVPASLIPASDQSQLASCTSSGTPGFCAPDSITQSGGEGVPPTCTSIAGAEGRCLSTCLPQIASEASLLPQSTCPTGDKCAPCYNPTSSTPNTPTGACSLACDKPAQPPTVLSCPWTGPPVLDPTTLPACDNGGCGGAHCLPASEVPASVQSQLATCNGGAGFCTPDPIISTANNYVPPTCDPFPAGDGGAGSGFPGRCLSSCLPEVQKEVAAGTLVQSSCASGNYCVPCNDPFTGASTGACTLACDTPPTTPSTFPKCCNDGSGTLTGTCVPSALVPSSEQSEVNQGGNGNSAGCPASAANYLCVPDEYLPAPYNTVPLQYCQSSILGIPTCGTCVSKCIVNAELNLFSQSNCAANHLCPACSLASSTPGCSTFCASGTSCGNKCGCNADCKTGCGTCTGGNGTCGSNTGTCQSP